MVGEIEPTSNVKSHISKKFCSIGNGKSSLLKKVKLKGGKHCVRILKARFAAPLHAEVPKLGNKGVISWTQFVERYGLCFEWINPKQVKVFKDITLEEVNKIFKPIVNKNGYSYVHNKDPNFIHKVETLWMIVHQKPYLHASKLIPLGMARGLMFEEFHGKHMNWAFYVEWINNE